MKLYEFSNGDAIHKYEKSIVICFNGQRNVLSTGPNNGGFRTDLTAVFNNDGNPGSGMAIKLLADTYREHMDILAESQLGLESKTCTGLMTAASMNNASIHSLTYDDFTVTAIVTAGVRSNGGRIGDPASWHEKAENSYEITPGTINILLYIDACLSKDALAGALVSCTEAKTAALQELLIPSRYSNGLATGTGTDGVIIISNAESSVHLTNAGKHSKLGEYIGKTVITALKESLYLQQGINAKSQHDIINRMDRFGITPDSLWKRYEKKQKSNLCIQHTVLCRADFTDILDRIKTEEQLVTYTSLYVHLLDQMQWGLLTFQECLPAGKQLLQLAGFLPLNFEDQTVEEEQLQQNESVEYMINLYKDVLIDKIISLRH